MTEWLRYSEVITTLIVIEEHANTLSFDINIFHWRYRPHKLYKQTSKQLTFVSC